jgi:hypothetical protein
MTTQTDPVTWDVFVAPSELTVIDDLAPGAPTGSIPARCGPRPAPANRDRPQNHRKVVP